MQQLHPVKEDWQTGLVVVAHPDDIEYGASGAIARWTKQGKRITYLLLTRGEAGIDSIEPGRTADIRTREQVAAAEGVGVDDVRFLDHPDGVLEYSLALRRDVARVIRDVRPEVCITLNHREYFPGERLNMADHRVAGSVLIDAIRDAGNRWVFLELPDEGYEPWSGVHTVLVSNSPRGNHAVDIDDTIQAGVTSLRQHETYLDNLADHPEPDAFIRGITASAGENYTSTYASAFEVISV
ncbi:PIG-L domain-containing protein [Candidatus Saccharibacteria bacterium QS_8_54_8]|nr:MAG: PIG-L domain-containing protein [Candidatus Saccharibacteria bacterium QS_8_54_8]